MRFYLGTHEVSWLARTDVPLFVSHRRLARRRRLPVASAGWSLDSGGFSELSMHGRWETAPTAYAAAIERYRDHIGGLDWVAPQDWMCEPAITAKTGRTVRQHQQATVASVLDLRSRVANVPIVPVLQGWNIADYLRCVDLYDNAGIDLTLEPVVGLGSVCRRQATGQIAALSTKLAAAGIALHGFGVKTTGLGLYARHLVSADSMAWSYAARHQRPMPGCTHRNCANCLRWALRWRAGVLRRLACQQLSFADVHPQWDAA